MKNDWQKAEKVLKSGGVGVIPTDTLYGLCASVYDKKAIEKIYKIKSREKNKPLIVLISSVDQLKDFGINLPLLREGDQNLRWSVFVPKVSILLPVKNKFKYIHRGTKEIAFRLISRRNKNLYHLIYKVGPIVAPSANPEGGRPAENIIEAKKYFDNKIDVYINGGRKIGEPSTLVRLLNGEIEVLRQGRIKLK